MPVFNLSVSDEQKRTWRWVMEEARSHAMKYPFEVGLWYPDGNITTSPLYHWICMILFMWFPALLIDLLMTLIGQRRL